MQDPILILGASGGVGSQIARTLAERRTDVPLILHGRREEALLDLVGHIGGNAAVMSADLTDAASVRSLFAAIDKKYGALSAVVFSVASPFRNRFAHNTSLDEVRIQFELQVFAFHSCCSLALPLLTARGQSTRMIVVSSEYAVTAPAKTAAYSAAKAALTQYAKVLSKEWIKKNVRVHIVAPGMMRTGMTDHLPEEFLLQVENELPERRLTSTLDAARVVDFLLREDGDAMYGVPVMVSRGAK